MKKVIEDLKTYWWIITALLSLLVFGVIEWQKIETNSLETQEVRIENENLRDEIDMVKSECSTKINGHEVRITVIESYIKDIRDSQLRFEEELFGGG